METWRVITTVLIVSLVVVGLVVAIPYVSVKLTKPTWALGKSIIEFVFFAFLFATLSHAFTASPIWALLGALIIAIFRYRARVARYKAISTLSIEDLGRNKSG